MKILIAGDFAAVRGIDERIAAGFGAELFSDGVLKVISAHDLTLVNVESVLAYEGQPIIKAGPNLKGPPATAGVLRSAGFNVALLANNHIGDFGEKGVFETISNLENAGMRIIGAGKNCDAASAPAEFGDIVVINSAENEFGVAVGERAGVNGLDEYKVTEQIRYAKRNGKFVLVVIHGGNEHNPLPSPTMKKRLRAFAAAGADAVVGGHTHCPQGHEIYNGVPIAYSMGNFVFSGSSGTIKMWNYGYMVSIETDGVALKSFSLIPYVFRDQTVRLLEGDERIWFDGYLKHISTLMNDDKHNHRYWCAWCSISGKAYAGELHRKMILQNTYNCEAHRELLAYYLRNQDEVDSDAYDEYRQKIKLLQQGEF